MIHLQKIKDERRCLEALVSPSLTGLEPAAAPLGEHSNCDERELSRIIGLRPS
jgi:hypothetical protein